MINSYIFDLKPISMQYKLISFILLTLVSFTDAFSQYTDMLNANRPGVSQGAFAVGNRVLQLESGLSYGKEKHSLLDTETKAWGVDYSIRYGFFKEQLEVNFIGEFQSDNITISRSAVDTEFKQSNFKSNTLGAKYLLYDPSRKRDLEGPNLLSWRANHRFQWADLIPAVSLYAGLNLDFADNPFTPEPTAKVSPKFALITQNNWVGGWVFVTNIIVDRISTDFPSYGYILTLTHATNEYFSIFVENQGLKSDFYSDQILRGGAAALVNSNFQVDLSVAVNFKDTPSKLFGRIGVAYRFDMHSQDEFLIDKTPKKKDKKEKKDKDEKVEEKNKRQDGLDLDDQDDN